MIHHCARMEPQDDASRALTSLQRGDQELNRLIHQCRGLGVSQVFVRLCQLCSQLPVGICDLPGSGLRCLIRGIAPSRQGPRCQARTLPGPGTATEGGGQASEEAGCSLRHFCWSEILNRARNEENHSTCCQACMCLFGAARAARQQDKKSGRDSTRRHQFGARAGLQILQKCWEHSVCMH